VCCVCHCDHLLVVEGPSSESPTLHRCVSMLVGGAALDRAALPPSPVRSPLLQVRSLPPTGEWTLAQSCAALWRSPPPVEMQMSAARTEATAAAGELTVLRSTTFPAAACSANGQSLSGEFTALAGVTSGPKSRRKGRAVARTGSPYSPALVTRRPASTSAWNGHRAYRTYHAWPQECGFERRRSWTWHPLRGTATATLQPPRSFLHPPSSRLLLQSATPRPCSPR